MHRHCFDILPHGNKFIMDQNLDTFIYNHKTEQWNQKASSQFPCDNKNQMKVHCKVFSNNLYVVVPSVLDELPCTAVFDVEKESWSKIESDDRKAVHNGTLQRHPTSHAILYFGGFEIGHGARDDRVWMFDENGFRWTEYSVKLPPRTKRNTAAMALVHPNACT